VPSTSIFAKAFDSVSHPKLLSKLSSLCLPQLLLKTLASFLNDRSQVVRVETAVSAPLHLNSGVPQGSVLGPILFVIFINDFPKCLSNNSRALLFADDLKLFQSIVSAVDMVVLQSNVDAILNWSLIWQLPIAIKKCAIINYGNAVYPLSVNVGAQVLPVLNNVTDLGIIFSSSLSFTDHICDIVKRAKARYNMLFRCFASRNCTYLVKGFICYVRPLVEYCSQVWSPTKISDIDMLESVQRSFTKRLPGMKLLSYPNRLAQLHICSLEERRLRLDLVFCYNVLHGFNCLNPTDIGLVVSSLPTRGHNLKLTTLHSNVDARASFFSNRVAPAWNALPNAVVICTDTTSFKRLLNKIDFTEHLVHSV